MLRGGEDQLHHNHHVPVYRGDHCWLPYVHGLCRDFGFGEADAENDADAALIQKLTELEAENRGVHDSDMSELLVLILGPTSAFSAALRRYGRGPRPEQQQHKQPTRPSLEALTRQISAVHFVGGSDVALSDRNLLEEHML